MKDKFSKMNLKKFRPTPLRLPGLIYLLAFFLSAKGWSQSRTLLTRDYTYLVADGGETRILHQSGDTLFIFDGQVAFEDHSRRVGQCFKVLSVRREEGFVFLKMKNLPNPQYPVKYKQKTTYSEWGIREISKNKLELVYWGYDTTQAGLYAQNISIDSLKKTFAITFYSKSEIEAFKQLKPIRTLSDSKEIIETCFSNMGKLRHNLRESNIAHNFLLGFLSGDLLTKACLSKGYNPLGAGAITDSILKSNRQQSDSLFARLKATYLQENNTNSPVPKSKTDKAPQVPVPDNE